MTAVASFRSRGIIGFVFIFTLLSLLDPACSWIGKKELQNMKENIQKLKQDVAMRKLDNKVDIALLSLLIEETINLTDIVSERLKSVPRDLQFPLERLKDLKKYLVESQDFMKKKFQNEAKQVKDYEDKLAHLETFVTNLADEHVDL